jgi:hypothetical protein
MNHGARFNSSEKFKKTQAPFSVFPREGKGTIFKGKEGKRRTTARGREEGRKKSWERSLFLA